MTEILSRSNRSFGSIYYTSKRKILAKLPKICTTCMILQMLTALFYVQIVYLMLSEGALKSVRVACIIAYLTLRCVRARRRGFAPTGHLLYMCQYVVQSTCIGISIIYSNRIFTLRISQKNNIRNRYIFNRKIAAVICGILFSKKRGYFVLPISMS